MVRRHRRSGFLPSAWVFPGGRVDPGDAVVDHPRIQGGRRAIQQMDLPEDAGRATLIAGVRETWEEAGIWLGDTPPPEDTRFALHRGDIGLPEVLEAHDTALDLDHVHPWSWWVTPKAEPRRYDTRFLIARASGGGRHDDIETTDSRWICPAEAVRAGQEGFPAAPPTWWSLLELSRFGSVGDVFDTAPTRPNRPIEPIMRFSEAGIQLLLPGHPEHPEDELLDLPHEVRAVQRHWKGFRHGVPFPV